MYILRKKNKKIITLLNFKFFILKLLITIIKKLLYYKFLNTTFYLCNINLLK